MQQVHVLHVYPGMVSSVAVPHASLLQRQLKEIIEKGGNRIVVAIPCGLSPEGSLDYVLVTEREQTK